jgi:hypothetical protein
MCNISACFFFSLSLSPRIREEDRRMAAQMSNLTTSSHHTHSHDFNAKDRSIDELIRDYSTDDTFSSTTPINQPLQPLQPFTAANPLITTDPFSNNSSSPSPRPIGMAVPVMARSSSIPGTPDGLPPPVYPQPPAYGAVTGSSFPPEHVDKVRQLMQLTHASESQCQLLLMCEGFDLDRACDSFYSGSFKG